MRDDRVLKVINDRNLVSYMNETKWRELIAGVQSGELKMPFRNKKIFSDEISLATLDLTLRSHYGYSDIEWVDFKSLNKINGARYTDAICNYLEKYNVPHTVYEDYIRVWGYTEPDNTEKIV